MANAVACGGWQCTTPVDVLAGLVDRQVQQDFARPLLDAGDLLAFGIDDAQVFRLHEALGDARRRAEDPVLARGGCVMLPSLAAANPRLYSRRPTSQISSRSLRSLNIIVIWPSISSFQRLPVDRSVSSSMNARGVSIHWLLLRQERHRRLRPFGECRSSPSARAPSSSQNDQSPPAAGVPLLSKRLQALRHAEHIALADQRRMHSRQRHLPTTLAIRMTVLLVARCRRDDTIAPASSRCQPVAARRRRW